jgi:hypothetical protein
VRAALLVTAAVLVLAAAAGCGGGSPQEPLGGGAVFMPANVVSFLAARADSDWQPLARRVLHRRPPRLPQDTVEVDMAVIPGGGTIVLTKPKNGDWRGTPANPPLPTLADNANYLHATRAAPKDSTAVAYVRGDLAAERLLAIPGQVATIAGVPRNTVRIRPHLQTHGIPVAELRWRWLAAWRAKDGFGARFRSSGTPVAASQDVRNVQQLVPEYRPALLDEIPADATSVVDAMLPPATFSFLGSAPPALRALLPGVDVEGLDAILGGETAIYTRPGGETTIVTSPGDVTTALHDLAPIRSLHTAVIGGQLVASTKADGITAFRGAGPKLGGKVDIPPRVAGFRWERGKRVAWASREGRDALFTVRPVGGAS